MGELWVPPRRCREEDSNLRRLSQRVYSPPPLATRESLRAGHCSPVTQGLPAFGKDGFGARRHQVDAVGSPGRRPRLRLPRRPWRRSNAAHQRQRGELVGRMLTLAGSIAALVAIAAGLAIAGSARADDDDDDDRPRVVRFSTFNASLNRNTAGELVTDLSMPNAVTPGTTQAKVIAEIVQRNRPDVLLINEFDFVPNNQAAESIPDELPVHQPERRFTDPLPISLYRAVQHRHRLRLRSEQQRFRRHDPRRVRLRRRCARFRCVPGPVRHGRLLEVSDPHEPDPHLPEVPVEGHAEREAARHRRDPGTQRLVLTRGARDLPPLVQEPLGHSHSHRRGDGALPDEPSDATGLRRNRGPQWKAKLRRDPLLRGLHSGGSTASYIYDDAGKRGGLKRGELFVIAGDQNSDPRDGDSIPGWPSSYSSIR